MADQKAAAPGTLERALLFLEERSGLVFGESLPESQRDFERAAWELGRKLDLEFPPFRAAEAHAVARFIAFAFMPPETTPWASPHQRDLMRDRALRAMRALLGRLPKGSPDALEAQKWLDFYGREEKQASAREKQIRARIEESERTPEQAGMIVTRSGDVLSREAVERLARGVAIAPVGGEPRSLPFRRPPLHK